MSTTVGDAAPMAGRAVGSIRDLWAHAIDTQPATREISLRQPGGAALTRLERPTTPRLASQISPSEGRGGGGAGWDSGGGRGGGGEPPRPVGSALEEPDAGGFITVPSDGASAHAPKPPSPPSTRPGREGWGDVEDPSEPEPQRAAAFADRLEKEGVPEWVPRGGAADAGSVRTRAASLASPRFLDPAATSLPLSARERDRYCKNPLTGTPPLQESTRQAELSTERGNGVGGVRGAGSEQGISIPELKNLVSSKLENLSSDRAPGDTSPPRPNLPRGAGVSGKRSEGRGSGMGSEKRDVAGAERTSQTLADMRHLSGMEKARALGRGTLAPGSDAELPWC